MKKFAISILLFFSILLVSYFVLATSAIENGASHVGNAVKDTAEGTKNIIMNAGNTIGNGIKNGTNTLSNSGEKTISNMENTTNSMFGSTNTNNTDSNYTSVRTAADVSVLGMTTNTWTWLIIAIVGTAIIGIVWYYGSQYEHKNLDNE